MRIAIAAMKQDVEDEVSHKGARATFFIVFDETGKLLEIIPNPFTEYDRAVGVRVADYLADKHVDVIAARHLGTGFTSALDNKGVRYVESSGTINSVAKELGVRFASS